MNTNANLTVASSGMRLEFILRWTARIWGVASTLLLLAFAFGGREHLRFTVGEAIAFLLFPIGAMVGFAVAWRRELLGGLIAVGSFVLFNFYVLHGSGRWPLNGYFLAFIAPGLFHFVNALLVARKPDERAT